jgi:hypothetical protein
MSLARSVALMGFVALGCGGVEDEVGSAPCLAGKLTLVGDLDGQPVSSEVDWTSFTWDQLTDPRHFSVTYDGGALELEWDGIVSSGNSIRASGSLVMPAGAPYAGNTICSGAGTRVADHDDVFPFVLRSLTVGTICPGTPVAGTLDGCVQDRPIP